MEEWRKARPHIGYYERDSVASWLSHIPYNPLSIPLPIALLKCKLACVTW